MTPPEVVGMFVGAVMVIAFVWKVDRRYRTNADAQKCMEKREAAEMKFEKRQMLTNLVLSELCEKVGIPIAKIQSFEKSLGIKLRDNNH